MENIELFDKYINNELSPEELTSFRNRLISDKEFASDFKIYSFTVVGLCREMRQDNVDFGYALKKLSKEELRGIVGKKNDQKNHVLRFKSWIWQAASIAAVVVIAFTAVLNIQHQADNKVCDAIWIAQSDNLTLSRGGDVQVNIAELSDDQIKDEINRLKQAYEQSEIGSPERADFGFSLSMSYIKLHDKEQAIIILKDLIAEYNGNEEYLGMIEKWTSILKLLQ